MADARWRLEPVGADWAERYRGWAPHIMDALRDAFDGGVVMDLAHVGGTAVPGLDALPTLDVMARVHPWPLPEEGVRALGALGFVDRGDDGGFGHGQPRRLFAHGGHEVHLHVVGLETGDWRRRVALRDLLRADEGARGRYARATRAALAAAASGPAETGFAVYQAAMAAAVEPFEHEALAWSVRQGGFRLLTQVAGWLADAPPRWAFAGGWALDACAGAPARDHEDVDVAVDVRAAAAVLDRLQAAGADVAWVVAGADGVSAYRRPAVGEAPPEGVHQAHARRGRSWVDAVLEPWSDGAWRYRRAPEIELPLEQAIRHVRAGTIEVPVLAPAAVLLFKATTGGRRTPRPKDDADLARVRALLTPEDRQWLRGALDATAPGHPWCAPGGALA